MTKTTDGKPRWEGPSAKPLRHINANWGPLEVSQFSGFSPESKADAVEKLAEQQDVQSLAKVLPLLVGTKGDLEDVLGRVIYATSHMLVDGGGNEAFARDWQHQLGHTAELAYRHASDNWRALASTRPQIEVQRFIGTACIAGDIFKRYGGASVGANKDLSWYLLENSTPHRVQVLEEVLRNKHPDRLPDASLDAVSGKVVCLGERLMLRQPTFLEAIENVYGVKHAGVGQQMREAFVRTLGSNEADLRQRSFWSSLQKWGAIEQADAVMMSTFNDKPHNDDDQTRKPMFEAAMNGAGPVLGRDIVQTVVMLGADVNRAYEPHGERFIDIAVDRNDPELFAWLIARGADPELKSKHPDQPQSAADRLERKAGSFVPDIVKAASEMKDLLLQWRAHREAQRAIEELGGLLPSHRVGP